MESSLKRKLVDQVEVRSFHRELGGIYSYPRREGFSERNDQYVVKIHQVTKHINKVQVLAINAIAMF